MIWSLWYWLGTSSTLAYASSAASPKMWSWDSAMISSSGNKQRSMDIWANSCMIWKHDSHHARSSHSTGSDYFSPLTPNSQSLFMIAFFIIGAANPSGSKILVTSLVKLRQVYSSVVGLFIRKPRASLLVLQTAPNTSCFLRTLDSRPLKFYSWLRRPPFLLFRHEKLHGEWYLYGYEKETGVVKRQSIHPAPYIYLKSSI